MWTMFFKSDPFWSPQVTFFRGLFVISNQGSSDRTLGKTRETNPFCLWAKGEMSFSKSSTVWVAKRRSHVAKRAVERPAWSRRNRRCPSPQLQVAL